MAASAMTVQIKTGQDGDWVLIDGAAESLKETVTGAGVSAKKAASKIVEAASVVPTPWSHADAGTLEWRGLLSSHVLIAGVVGISAAALLARRWRHMSEVEAAPQKFDVMDSWIGNEQPQQAFHQYEAWPQP